MIPKIFLQTTKSDPVPKHVIAKLKYFTGTSWKYLYFNDYDVIKYLHENPLSEFPLIVEKFKSIIGGAHKADLFRYYFLYKNGGVFLDSDAKLCNDINYLVKDYDFFTVVSTYKSYGESHARDTCFNGFIGCSPRHEIIKNALYDAYNVDINHLNDNYFYFCDNLWKYVRDYKDQYKENAKVRLLTESYINDELAKTYDEDKLAFIHYYKNKIIPIE
jgi:mannosyltransferase OCH1-like enzyme